MARSAAATRLGASATSEDRGLAKEPIEGLRFERDVLTGPVTMTPEQVKEYVARAVGYRGTVDAGESLWGAQGVFASVQRCGRSRLLVFPAPERTPRT